MRQKYLEVVRVQLEGPVASFRFPHFLIGRQPSFPMPPPSTIYGLISAALGFYPDPTSLHFAYHFECERTRNDDLETIWFVERNTSTREKSAEKNLEAQSNVLPRELLLAPKLTLYLAVEDDLDKLYKGFRSPAYILTLGRSQEMVSVRNVDVLQLLPARKGWLMPGLYPKDFWQLARFSPLFHMPRFVDPRSRYRVQWEWYLALDTPVLLTEDAPNECWTENGDSEQPVLLCFHNFN